MAILDVRDYGAIGDGIADDTQAFRTVLSSANAGDIVRFVGGFIITGTLTIPSGVTFEGGGKDVSKITLGSGFSLNWFPFRITRVQAIIVTEDNSQNITLQKFTLEGHKTEMVTGDWGLAGVLFQKTSFAKLHNVDVNWINLRTNLTSPSFGWNVISTDADNIEYYRCNAEHAGYQPFGFFDRTTNSKMHECNSGMGLRTSVQVHRDCDNIDIFNNTIVNYQNPTIPSEPHGAVTIHGEIGEEARNVTVNNNYVELNGGWKAAIQAFRSSVNATITNNEIKSNGEGVHLGSADGAIVEDNKITALPNTRELQLGNYGVSIIGNTKNSFVRYNEISGFDIPIYKDSTIGSSVIIVEGARPIEPDPTDPTERLNLRQAKLYINHNGKIVEVESIKNVDGVIRKSNTFIKY